MARSKKFVPGVISHLEHNGGYKGKLSDLPKSYQSQPHNLAAKIMERSCNGMKVQIFFNRSKNTFTIIKHQ